MKISVGLGEKEEKGDMYRDVILLTVARNLDTYLNCYSTSAIHVYLASGRYASASMITYVSSGSYPAWCLNPGRGQRGQHWYRQSHQLPCLDAPGADRAVWLRSPHRMSARELSGNPKHSVALAICNAISHKQEAVVS